MQSLGKSGIDKRLATTSDLRWSLTSLATIATSVLVVLGGVVVRGGSAPAAAAAAPMQVVRSAPEAGNSQAFQQRCDACHAFDSGFSHPTGVVPSMNVPQNLPLVDGRVSCLTCHTDDAARPHGSHTSGRSEMLREGTSAAGLCSSCHQPGQGAKRGHHGSDLVRAHLQTATWKAAPSGAMDAESRSCVACHDGSMAKDAGGHGMSGATLGSSGDHPIAVAYRSKPATHTEDEVRLVNMGALDRRVRLFDRTVGCGSCHSVYSGRQDLLVMPNIRSQLCLSCHSL
ncbi:MAG: hypothetical protein NTV94_09575 [Planctomycetota bacterium]|nr:hypothetical protein [Planctomycetota bacterium]